MSHTQRVLRSNVKEEESPESEFLEDRRREGPAERVVVERMLAHTRPAPRTDLRRLAGQVPAPVGSEQIEPAAAVRTPNQVLHRSVGGFRRCSLGRGTAWFRKYGRRHLADLRSCPAEMGSHEVLPLLRKRLVQPSGLFGTAFVSVRTLQRRPASTCTSFTGEPKNGNTANSVSPGQIFLIRERDFPYVQIRRGASEGLPCRSRGASVRSLSRLHDLVSNRVADQLR